MSRKDIHGSVAKRRKLSNGSAAHDVLSGGRELPSSPNEQAATVSQVSVDQSSRPVSTHPAHGHKGGSAVPTTATQVKSLLAEITPKTGQRLQDAVNLAQRIAEAIRNLPPAGPFTATEAIEYARKSGGITIPFPSPQPARDSKLKFEWIAPSIVTVQSSVTRSLSVHASGAVAIDVQMPQTLFQEKDYLNLRAFHKRAFYLTRIALALEGTFKTELDTKYHDQNGVALIPSLLLTPRNNASQGLRVEIIISFPSDVFPPSKTMPQKNCVRAVAMAATDDLPATPFYNSCLCHLTSIVAMNDLLERTSKRAAAFTDSVRLGIQWLKARGLDSSVSGGGFGWEEWANMCALLLHTGGPRGQPLFSDRYSALQLFKAMLQTLASRDMLDPWILRGSAIEIPRTESPVLYDVETGSNVLFQVSAASYKTLRNYAQASLTVINSKEDNSLDQTFNAQISMPSLQDDESYLVEHYGNTSDAASQLDTINKLHRVLQRGLDDRVRHLNLRPNAQRPWKTSTQRQKQWPAVRVSLSIEPRNATRLVDHGPSAEDQTEAAEYQNFWGEKAELRRFKDGSITESLVWTSTEPVTYQILKHLLQRHFSIDPDRVSQEGFDLEKELSLSTTTAKQYFAIIDQAYQKLSTSLLALSDLPLPIRSVSPASEILRSSSLAVPVGSGWDKPIDVLIEFDSSGRWPDSLPAIQHTKIAFLVKLGDVIAGPDPSLSAQVGLENTDADISGYFNTSFLDLTYPSPGAGLRPIVFRLRIVHERELHLLQGASADKSLTSPARESVASALATYKRDFVSAPKHTTALRVLMTQFPALSTTIRLLKGWSCAHLLAQHVPNEALELIACSVYLRPAPWATPASPTAAFMRSLAFLAQWDWTASPLTVDLSPSQDMSTDQQTEIRTRFEAWRKLDPLMNQVSWFIGSSVDETGVVWTVKSRMEKVIAARVQAVATACLELVRGQADSLSQDTARGFFTPPLADYDFLITLHKRVLPRKDHQHPGPKEKFRNLTVESEINAGAVGFDAVQVLLNDLNKVFGHPALFLYGTAGNADKIIAGLWRPAVQGTKDWRVRLGWSSMPAQAGEAREQEVPGEETRVMLNKKGILAEIGMVGRDLIKDIKVQR